MDLVNYYPQLTPAIVERGLLANDPFVLVDVGCGLGVDPLWNVFGDALRAHGIDPQLDEIDRLRATDQRPGVKYHAAFVGLPVDHPFHSRREARAADAYFNPLARSSTLAALESATRPPHATEFEATSEWRTGALADDRVTLDAFCECERLASVDLIKVDTDGADLEVVLSAEKSLADRSVLGLVVESWYTGTSGDSENTFANLDRLLKSRGYMLFTGSMHRYSRAALPAVYEYDALAGGTLSGQPVWGDFVYLRDAGSPDYEAVWGDELPARKLLKLIALYELFRVPDCAAETILRHEEALRPLVDTEQLLDLLTPPLRGEKVRYREYVEAFRRDPTSFFPSAQLDTAGPIDADPAARDDGETALLRRRLELAERELGALKGSRTWRLAERVRHLRRPLSS